MHGLKGKTSFLKEGLPFAQDLSLKNSADSCLCFLTYDLRKFRRSVTEISSSVNREITVIINHYSKEKANTYKYVTINKIGDIDGVAAIEQCLGIRKYMFEKRKTKETFQM